MTFYSRKRGIVSIFDSVNRVYYSPARGSMRFQPHVPAQGFAAERGIGAVRHGILSTLDVHKSPPLI